MASRSRAVPTSVWVCMLARCITRVTQRALPAAWPRGTGVAALLVTRDLGSPRRWWHRENLRKKQR